MFNNNYFNEIICSKLIRCSKLMRIVQSIILLIIWIILDLLFILLFF